MGALRIHGTNSINWMTPKSAALPNDVHAQQAIDVATRLKCTAIYLLEFILYSFMRLIIY